METVQNTSDVSLVEVAKKNGKPMRDVGDTVSIEPDELADLRALNTRGQNLRNSLADLTLQFELKKAELISSIVSTSKNIETAVTGAASKQGIALDGSTGLWTFDFDTYTFVRTA